MIGNRQRIAISSVAQQKFPFVVGAPEFIGVLSQRQARALGSASGTSSAPDQAMSIEHGMNGAAGGNPNLRRKTTQQALPDFAGAPVRLLAFQAEDGTLDLLRQLIAVAPGSSRPVRERF